MPKMTYYKLADNILETLAGLHSNGRPTNVRLGREMDISDRLLVYWALLSCAGSNGDSYGQKPNLPAFTYQIHGQTSANRTKPGPSFQL